MAMIMGPHTALGNIPRSIEYGVGWLTGMFEHMQKHGYTRFEATKEGAKDWTKHVNEIGSGLLSSKVDSWMTGVNKNVEGKTERYVARYSGSAAAFRKKCEEVSENGYKAMSMS